MKKQKFWVSLLFLFSSFGWAGCHSFRLATTPYTNQELLLQQAQQCAANYECFFFKDSLQRNLVGAYLLFNQEYEASHVQSQEANSIGPVICHLSEFSKVVLASNKPVTPDSLEEAYHRLYPQMSMKKPGTTRFPKCVPSANPQKSLDPSP